METFWTLVAGIVIGMGIERLLPTTERIPKDIQRQAEEMASTLGIDPEHIRVRQEWSIDMSQEGYMQMRDKLIGPTPDDLPRMDA